MLIGRQELPRGERGAGSRALSGEPGRSPRSLVLTCQQRRHRAPRRQCGAVQAWPAGTSKMTFSPRRPLTLTPASRVSASTDERKVQAEECPGDSGPGGRRSPLALRADERAFENEGSRDGLWPEVEPERWSNGVQRGGRLHQSRAQRAHETHGLIRTVRGLRCLGRRRGTQRKARSGCARRYGMGGPALAETVLMMMMKMRVDYRFEGGQRPRHGPQQGHQQRQPGTGGGCDDDGARLRHTLFVADGGLRGQIMFLQLRCEVEGDECRVPGAGCQVSGVRCQVSGVRC